MRRMKFKCASVCAVWLCASVGVFAAELEVREVDNPRFEREGAMYRKYCGACHGVRGEGDGVVAPLMDPRPIDLTRIKANFGGPFPKYLVVVSVDGRGTVRAHGESDMPVWGDVFAEEFLPDPAATARARGKIMEIADYIESIQK